MIKLTAIYKQQANGKWDAWVTANKKDTFIKEADDLETAKVFLRIYVAEAIAQMFKIRTKWDITQEHIYKYDFDKENILKTVIENI